MTQRRALIVAYNFPPNAVVGTMRTLRLVEQLASEPDRWDVTVLTATSASHLPHEPVDPDLLERVPHHVRVCAAAVWRPLDLLARAVRRVAPRRAATDRPTTSTQGVVPSPTKVSTSLPRRAIDFVDTISSIPDSESGWIVPAVCRGLILSRRWRPDVIYSTAPSWSAQVVGYQLARMLGCRWVADFRDPWARGPWREGLAPLILASWRALERRVVQRADVLVLNTQLAREEFARFYGPAVAGKLHVVTNGCDVGELTSITRRPSDRFVLLHAGSLYGGRNSDTLVKAIASAIGRGAIARDAVRVRLLGASPDCQMATTARVLGLGDVVECVPRVARRESLEQMASASALLLLQPGHALSVPAKTYEYLATGRPILALADEGETATVVRESGVGVVAPAHDLVAVESGLLAVMALARLGVPAPDRTMFDGALRARELAHLLTSVTSSADATVPATVVASPRGSHHA